MALSLRLKRNESLVGLITLQILGSLLGCVQVPIGHFESVVTTNGPKIYAWGNSQTQGYGLDGCETLVCHPVTAWPQFLANAKGWTLDNQAYGASVCADLTYRGTSLSLWDLAIDADSLNIYAHFRNDQSQYGPLPYRVAFARGCIEAQTAWLAIPESAKLRANSSQVVNSGTWANSPQNSAGSYSSSIAATKTFVVTGKTIYLATARNTNGNETRYTVSVDGNPIEDPITKSTVFTQDLDVRGQSGLPINEDMIQNFIRVPGLTDTQHTIVYTCVNPASTGCYVFYAAGTNRDGLSAKSPLVYSLSPLNNQFRYCLGNQKLNITAIYHDAWKKMVAELDGDGLNVLGVDATDSAVYDSLTQSQPDGIHPNLTGNVSIAAGAGKATLGNGASF